MHPELRMLADTVPSRPAGDLDDEALLAKSHGSTRFSLTTVEVCLTAPRMLRITLSGAGIETMHGHGIGAAWAEALRPGDTVRAIGPRGKLLLNPAANWHVLIGHETSLPGIHAMLAATDAPAQVLVEVDDPADWQGYGPRGRSRVATPQR